MWVKGIVMFVVSCHVNLRLCLQMTSKQLWNKQDSSPKKWKFDHVVPNLFDFIMWHTEKGFCTGYFFYSFTINGDLGFQGHKSSIKVSNLWIDCWNRFCKRHLPRRNISDWNWIGRGTFMRIHGRIGEENYCGWPDLLIQSVSHPKLSDGFGRLWIKHLYFFTFLLLCKWWQNVHFWVNFLILLHCSCLNR